MPYHLLQRHQFPSNSWSNPRYAIGADATQLGPDWQSHLERFEAVWPGQHESARSDVPFPLLPPSISAKWRTANSDCHVSACFDQRAAVRSAASPNGPFKFRPLRDTTAGGYNVKRDDTQRKNLRDLFSNSVRYQGKEKLVNPSVGSVRSVHQKLGLLQIPWKIVQNLGICHNPVSQSPDHRMGTKGCIQG
jgi:hypothetical protein